MKRPKSGRVDVSLEALEAILEQARSALLCEMQIEQLQGVLHTLGRLTQELEKKRTSIHRLRSLLFGPKSEKTEAVVKRKKSQDDDTSQTANRGQEKQKKPKGHGRNGADAYLGAQLPTRRRALGKRNTRRQR